MNEQYTVYTVSSFEREYKKLKRRFPNLDEDYEELLDEIEILGDLGDSWPGIVNDGNKVFKKRMKNSSARKSKRGGFRVVEYLVTENNNVYLLDIYSKSDKENIKKQRIQDLIRQIDDKI